MGGHAGRTVLRCAAPARRWVEAFPLGNGRLGAMVFGGLTGARVQVNDATAWSGGPGGPRAALADLLDRGAGPDVLARLRAAVAADDDTAATALAQQLQGPYAQAFQPFVDVVTDVRVGDPAGAPRAGSGAGSAAGTPAGAGPGARTLDLRDGVAAETWSCGGARVETAWYASAVDGCLHGRWRSDGPPFDLRLAVTSAHPLRPGAVAVPGGLALRVVLPHDVAPGHEPSFPAVTRTGAGDALVGAVVLAASSDGSVAHAEDDVALAEGGVADGAGGPRALRVRGATWVEVVLATATTARWPEPGPLRDPADADAEARDRAAGGLPSDAAAGDAARERHAAEHRALADRTALRLGSHGDLVLDLPGALDTASLADRAQAAFAFGRYLLLASSRPGSPPATLQGVWNEQVQPPWSSGYTQNVNLQMAYWAADRVGLPECADPLVDHVRVLAREGAAVARDLYGCRGWVAHHNSDLWGWSLPVGAGHGDPAWAGWWLAGPWLCRHLWEHWRTTLDLTFLRDVAWPLLRGAARFCVDWLVETPDGGLVPSPSSSPENVFRRPDGTTAALCAGSALDVALVRAHLAACLEAVAVLSVDEPDAPGWERALARLPEATVGADGLVREWASGVDAVDPHHRHLSHLVGLYPLELVDVDDTPDLARAASRSLDARGPGSTGWSLAWKVALRARLGQGDAVEALLGEALAAADGPSGGAADGPVGRGPWAGGLLPNLFSTHPPFQVDGNLGLVAGMAEAVVSSTAARLRVLPALPPSWRDGELTGVRTHGRLVVDVRWSDGALAELVLRPGADVVRRVVARGAEREVVLRAGETVRLGRGLADVPLDGRVALDA